MTAKIMKRARAGMPAHSKPILVLSTEQAAPNKAEARNAGASAWLPQPFAPRHLQGDVPALIRRRPQSGPIPSPRCGVDPPRHAMPLTSLSDLSADRGPPPITPPSAPRRAQAHALFADHLGDDAYGIDRWLAPGGRPWEPPGTPETPEGIAGTQGVMKGVLRLQGSVVPAIDLQPLLGQQAASFDEHTEVIVPTLRDPWLGGRGGGCDGGCSRRVAPGAAWAATQAAAVMGLLDAPQQ